MLRIDLRINFTKNIEFYVNIQRCGEELRRWHNKECGHEDVDGVVNPAVQTIAG